MVFSCRSCCLDLPGVLIDCRVEGCASRLHRVCRGGVYVAMHEIYIDGAERKILCDCVEELRMGGNPEKMKKVGHRTMYGTDE